MRAYVVRNFALSTVEISVEKSVAFGILADASDAAVRESAVRVMAALAALGPVPAVRVTVKGEVGRSLSDLDLAIVLAVLEHEGMVSVPEGLYCRAELELSGRLRDVVGHEVATSSRRFAARATAAEFPDVGSVVRALPPIEDAPFEGGARTPEPHASLRQPAGVLEEIRAAAAAGEDLVIVGQTRFHLPSARWYADHVVASAGAAGQARRFHSLIGSRPVSPPFRAPHHSVSEAGMTGDQSRPGETDLASGGTLVLASVTEFRKDVLRAVGARRRSPRPGHPHGFAIVATHDPQDGGEEALLGAMRDAGISPGVSSQACRTVRLA